MAGRGKGFWLLATLPGLFGFDFATKEWARDLQIGHQTVVVDGWVSLTHAENPFIAFSTPVPLPVIFTVGLFAVVALAWTWWRLPADARWQSAALGVLGAGVLGNLVDRIGDGTVTDMVRVYTEHPALEPWLVQTFGTATWPIFNVADAALLSGVGLWLVHDLVQRDSDEVPEP